MTDLHDDHVCFPCEQQLLRQRHRQTESEVALEADAGSSSRWGRFGFDADCPVGQTPRFSVTPS